MGNSAITKEEQEAFMSEFVIADVPMGMCKNYVIENGGSRGTPN